MRLLIVSWSFSPHVACVGGRVDRDVGILGGGGAGGAQEVEYSVRGLAAGVELCTGRNLEFKRNDMSRYHWT